MPLASLVRMPTTTATASDGSLPRVRSAAIITAVWVAVALVAAGQTIALVRLTGRADLAGSMLSRLSILPLWALATPLILRSARSLSVLGPDGRPNVIAAAGHVALGSVFIVATNVIVRLPLAVAADGGLQVLARSTMQGVAEFYPPALVIYGVIVAVGHGLSRRSAAVRQLASPDPVVPATAIAETPLTEPRVTLPAESAVEIPPEDANRSTTGTNGHLTVRQWNRVHLVPLEDIDWVEAQDNYIVIHAASRAYKGRDRISDVEGQLDARRFVRIHRSTIVHTAKIRELQPLTHGDHAVILRDGTVLRVARSRRQALGEALGIEL